MACRLARSLVAVGVAVALAATATLAPSARADGDPASDVLLGQDVFYPYSPTVSPSLQRRLNAATKAIRRARSPVKIAIIATPVDLGVIPSLFDKPAQYANFLDQEISFTSKQPLLVVMPSGYGAKGLSAKATAVVRKLTKPSGRSGDALATAALGAVQKIASAEGHPLPGASSGGGGSGVSRNTWIVILLALAATATAIALGIVTVRRRRTPA